MAYNKELTPHMVEALVLLTAATRLTSDMHVWVHDNILGALVRRGLVRQGPVREIVTDAGMLQVKPYQAQVEQRFAELHQEERKYKKQRLRREKAPYNPLGYSDHATRYHALAETVDFIVAQRCLRHLNKRVVEAYLRHYAASPLRDKYDSVVALLDYTELPCQKWDALNAARLVAWRLGVCCYACGCYMGKRIRLTWRAKEPAAAETWDDHRAFILGADFYHYPVCDPCQYAEQKAKRKWHRIAGNVPVPEEWVLLYIAEEAVRSLHHRSKKRRPA